MGGGASRRYMMGMNPDRFFEEKVVPELSETLEILEISQDDARKLFDHYIAIDTDNSGEVSVGELHAFLSLKQTKFTERVFVILDLDGSGYLDFREFAIGVWNYCTYDIKLIAKLAFDIFDIDKIGQLEVCECDALIRMMWAPANNVADPLLVSRIEEFSTDEIISFERFVEAIERYETIIQPALDLQRVLRQKFLGVKYWETKTQRRMQLFATLDGVHDSWEAVQEILLKRQKERQGVEVAKQEEAEAQREERLMDFQREAFAHHRDRQMAKKRKLQALKEKRTVEDDLEAKAMEKLETAQEHMEREYKLESLKSRRKWRDHLWEAFDKLVEYSDAAIKAQEDKELQVAVSADAIAKADAYLETEEGQWRYDFDVKARYGNLLHEKWTHGNGAQRALSSLFEPTIEGQVTVATRMALKVSRKKDMNVAKDLARKAVIERYQQEDSKQIQKEYKNKYDDKHSLLDELELDLVEQFGTRNTKWEKLWDEEKGMYFWYHIEDKKKFWTEPAICENCDCFIDPMDPKCFECNTKRSDKNQTLYEGAEVMSQWTTPVLI